MAEIRVVTSALSLARELWRYGEPELAERALQLKPQEVAEVGSRMGQMLASQEGKRLWPTGPKNAVYLLAAIERLEGTPRPPARTRRLPENRLPAHLQATLRQRLDAASEFEQATRATSVPEPPA